MDEVNVAKILYKNWKGETRERLIIPLKIYHGNNQYHTQEQWLLRAFDNEKKEVRTFAMRDIIKWIY